MPIQLEQKLKQQYPNNPKAVYGTMNKIGAMKGNQVNPKGVAMQKRMIAQKMQSSPKPLTNQAMQGAYQKAMRSGKLGQGFGDPIN